MRLSMFGAALAVAAMSLAACNTVLPTMTAPPGSVSVTPPAGLTTISADAQKALWFVERTYNTAARVYLAAAPKLAPADKAKRKAQVQALYQVVLVARHAATLADSAGVIAAAGSARSRIDVDPSLVHEN